VRFGEGATLFDLWKLGDYLENLFRVPVDIVSERALHPMMKDYVLKELVSIMRSPSLSSYSFTQIYRTVEKIIDMKVISLKRKKWL
jgi:hypothetical protein